MTQASVLLSSFVSALSLASAELGISEAGAGENDDCFVSQDHFIYCCCLPGNLCGNDTSLACCPQLREGCPADSLVDYDHLTASGPSACFEEILYPQELCCDQSLDSKGFTACWTGSANSYEKCCNSSWQEFTQGQCPEDYLHHVWAFMLPGSINPYRILFASESYYGLKRIASRWLERVKTDESTALVSMDATCTVASIGSRILAFSKLGWEDQWSILFSPEQYLEEEWDPQRIFIVDAVKSLLVDLPILSLISPSAKPWGSTLLHLIIRHMRKMSNFLTPYRPFKFDGHFEFPRSDARMDNAAWTFLRKLRSCMHHGRFLTTAEADDFIAQRLELKEKVALPCHEFVLAMGYLARAYAILRNTDYSQEDRRMHAAEAVQRADHELRRWIHRWPEDKSHLFFTQWPFWSLLHELASLMEGVATKPSLSSGKIPQVRVVYCGPNFASLPSGEVAGFNFLLSKKVSSGNCTEEDRTEQLMQALEDHSAAWTVIISSFTWNWTSEQTFALIDGLAFSSKNNVSIMGFPSINSNNTWYLPIRRIRHRFWKLEYGHYPTGYPATMGPCSAGDATSGTRIYRTSVLRELLLGDQGNSAWLGRPTSEETLQTDEVDNEGSSLTIALDILAHQLQLPVLTCMHAAMLENDYLTSAVLTNKLATSFQIERARFSTKGDWYERCLDVDKQAEWPVINYELSQGGMVTRYCWRVLMEKQVVDTVATWNSIDNRHFVMAKQGTLLTALARGGEFGMMPWDFDLELVLASRGPNLILQECSGSDRNYTEALACAAQLMAEKGLKVERHLGPIASMNFISELGYERTGGSLAKVRLELGYNLDVHLDDFLSTEDSFEVPLFGTKVHVLRDHWTYQLFDIYNGDLHKKFGTAGTIDRSHEQCARPGHNACIHLSEPNLQGQHAAAAKDAQQLGGRPWWCRGWTGSTDTCGNTFELSDHFAHTLSPE
eukprot:TRINITY_DN45625_c0_g1_i1.p1 TRINITY_DN45625_c0_g1~~TRINITY_DN45625_c0_g1_i1.p1  ORF type:complete len:952 (-),score=111.38 TRINITY_DN45625_c0_g1_i1:56-2911(-)